MGRRAAAAAAIAPTSAPATTAGAGVTADEVARAIAAIEGRRRAGEGRHADAALVGAVLEEMGLEGVTPAEVLAEVEAQRATTERERGVRQAVRRGALHRRGFAVGAAATVLVALGVGGFARTRQAPPAVTVGVGTVSAPAGALPPAYTTRTVVHDQGPDGPALRTLAEVPDGRPVRVHLGMEEQNGASVLVMRDFTPGHDPAGEWAAVRFGGRTYLRAYAALASDAALGAGDLAVWRKPGQRGGLPTAPVNIPLDGLRGLIDFWGGALHLEGVRFDEHVRDNVPSEPTDGRPR